MFDSAFTKCLLTDIFGNLVYTMNPLSEKIHLYTHYMFIHYLKPTHRTIGVRDE